MKITRQPLRISLFGPMQVWVGATPLPRLRSRKGLWLLALLALRGGQPVDREWLAATLWPDDNDRCGRRSLRQSLHDLRSALGPEAERLIRDAPGSLSLNTADSIVDALQFDDRIRQGDCGALEEAIRLYRGPLLENCAAPWCLEERERRALRYLSALETLAGTASARGDAKTAVGYLERAVVAEPFRDDLQRARMRALADSGNTAQALLYYQQYRAWLRREMAAEPAEETTALFCELRDWARPGTSTHGNANSTATAVFASDTRPAGLPVPLTRLVGREDAVGALIALLSSTRLLSLTGTGGIGKTRLAIAVAEKIARERGDAAYFVDLAPVAPSVPVAEAVRAALQRAALQRMALKITPQNARENAKNVLRDFLSAGCVLLVLDNCEHLLTSCAHLAEFLLRECPNLQILATSRHALRLRGETVWQVPPLEEDDAAVRLFIERARAADRDFAVTAHTLGRITSICRRLDGIPLAIELAAAWVRSLSVAEISSRLQQNFDLLMSADTPFASRQQTLATTFDWSWNLLCDTEQHLLARLSVFTSGWTLNAAMAVGADDRIEPSLLLDLLTRLVDKSLVRFTASSSSAADEAARTTPSRYHLLETVREYAAQCLRRAGGEEEESARRRHRDYFLSYAEETHPKLRGPEQAFWFQCLEAEHDNLRAALREFHRRGAIEAELRLAVALCRFWDTHGHLQEGQDCLSAVLSRLTPDLPHALRAGALACTGWIAFVQTDYPRAHHCYEQALRLLREQGDTIRIADTLNLQAMVALDDGDLARAQTLFEEALTLCRDCPRTPRRGSLLNNLGDLALRRKDYPAAQHYFEQSIRWCESVGDRQLHGLVLQDLATADLEQDRAESARRHAAAGLRLLQESGALIDIAAGLDQMARIAQAQNDPARAACLQGSADQARAITGAPPSRIAEVMTECADWARAALGANAFHQAFARGQAMPLDQAVDFATLPDVQEIREIRRE